MQQFHRKSKLLRSNHGFKLWLYSNLDHQYGLRCKWSAERNKARKSPMAFLSAIWCLGPYQSINAAKLQWQRQCKSPNSCCPPPTVAKQNTRSVALTWNGKKGQNRWALPNKSWRSILISTPGSFKSPWMLFMIRWSTLSFIKTLWLGIFQPDSFTKLVLRVVR